jgi:hypothetical protein
MAAYCTVNDLRKGDIPLPSYMGDGQKYVDGAADEIDAALGHIYVTPIALDPATKPEQRPASLLLKKINWLLASGRLVLDLAAAGENTDLHAYGRQMLTEGLMYLQQLTKGEIVLTGAAPIPVPEGQEKSFSGPAIFNEDPESLVEAFYTRHNGTLLPAAPAAPYGAEPRVYPYGVPRAL